MRVTASVRWRLWLQHLLFLLLFGLLIGLLAWLSYRYPLQADWTFSTRNSLSESSQQVLASLSQPVRITAFARDNAALRDGISRLIARYQRLKSDLQLIFVNPDLLPDRVRELGISLDGELYLQYQGRSEKVQRLSEQALTSALQRLNRRQDQPALFLEGHGERKGLGIANHDLGTFGRELEKIGIPVRSVNLSEVSLVPSAGVLVIAGPQQPLAADEIKKILSYIAQGGNLLWLLEPGDIPSLQSLAALLGLSVLPGVIVDPKVSRLGIKNPAFIPIIDYGLHPITQSLRTPALLPHAAALIITPIPGWSSAILLESQAETWTETAPVGGSIQFDVDTAERQGPLTVGVALFRPTPKASTVETGSVIHTQQQRVVIVGDGDFLSNTYLGNGANLELGLNVLNWLTLEETPSIVQPKTVPDPNLNLSERTLAFMALLFLVVIPIVLLASGWSIWFYRQRRRT